MPISQTLYLLNLGVEMGVIVAMVMFQLVRVFVMRLASADEQPWPKG